MIMQHVTPKHNTNNYKKLKPCDAYYIFITENTTTSTTNQELYQNLCTARTIGGFDDEENNQCTCYEFEELVHLMSEDFGEESCGYATPQPTSEEDAEVWYSCTSSSTTNDNDTKSRPMISAKLVATGILGYFPIPASFTIYTIDEELPVPTHNASFVRLVWISK